MDKPTVDYYDGNAADVGKRFETADMERLHALMLEHFPGKGARVLEIGCGSGRDAAFLLSRGYDVRAVDASRGLVEEATRIHPELQGRLSVAAVPFPEGHPLLAASFQAVLSMAVLMHVPEGDLPETVSQIRRILEPGGVAFISVSTDRPGVGRDGRGPGGRLFLERPPEVLQRLFEERGFRMTARHDTPDVYARGIAWHSMVFEAV